MFECACGQIGRSLVAINGHPLGKNCGLDQNGDFDLVKSELEPRPNLARSGNFIYADPEVDSKEVFK